MKPMITILLFAVLLFSTSCDTDKAATNLSQEMSEPKIEVAVSNPAMNAKGEMKFTWTIKNVGDGNVAVYSSLLDETGFAELKIDSSERRVDVVFTRRYPLTAVPYYFPATRFTDLAPGESFEGVFNTTSIEDKRTLSKLAPGDWSVLAIIAFGRTRPELDATKPSGNSEQTAQHPVNQVIRWQTLAQSNRARLISNLEF